MWHERVLSRHSAFVHLGSPLHLFRGCCMNLHKCRRVCVCVCVCVCVWFVSCSHGLVSRLARAVAMCSTPDGC